MGAGYAPSIATPDRTERNEATARIRPLSAVVLRRVHGVLLPMLAFLALGVIGVLQRERARDRGLAEEAAQGVTRLQARTIEREVELVCALFLRTAERRRISNLLSGRGNPDAVREDLAALLSGIEIFARARLLDDLGRELVDVRLGEQGPFAVSADALGQEQDRYYLARAWELEPGRVYVSPFTLRKEGERLARPLQPILRFLTPVRDAEGAKAGLFEVEFLGRELLDRVAREGEILGGWTALVTDRGQYLESPDGEASWGFVFGRPPTFAAEHGSAWEAMRAERAGAVLVARGLYAHRRLRRPDHPRIGRFDLDLRAVAFVPPERVYEASSNTASILFVGGALVGLALAGLAWRLAYVGAVRRRHERELAASRKGLRQLSGRMMEAEEEERRRLSRDLHDDLGQQATALVIELKRLAHAQPGALDAGSLGRAIDAGESLLESLHRMATELRSGLLEDLGLYSALEAQCADFEERFGVTTRCELDFEDDAVPAAVARHVHRIVQEALTNVAKHARASEVRVRVRAEGATLRVDVVDDGIGCEAAAAVGDRLGLLGMRERVEQVGGRFRLRSGLGEGTHVEATIDLARDQTQPA